MQMSMRDEESRLTMHVHVAKAMHSNEATLHITIVTSVNSDLVLDSSMPMGVTGKLGC